MRASVVLCVVAAACVLFAGSDAARIHTLRARASRSRTTVLAHSAEDMDLAMALGTKVDFNFLLKDLPETTKAKIKDIIVKAEAYMHQYQTRDGNPGSRINALRSACALLKVAVDTARTPAPSAPAPKVLGECEAPTALTTAEKTENCFIQYCLSMSELHTASTASESNVDARARKAAETTLGATAFKARADRAEVNGSLYGAAPFAKFGFPRTATELAALAIPGLALSSGTEKRQAVLRAGTELAAYAERQAAEYFERVVLGENLYKADAVQHIIWRVVKLLAAAYGDEAAAVHADTSKALEYGFGFVQRGPALEALWRSVADAESLSVAGPIILAQPRVILTMIYSAVKTLMVMKGDAATCKKVPNKKWMEKKMRDPYRCPLYRDDGVWTLPDAGWVLLKLIGERVEGTSEWEMRRSGAEKAKHLLYEDQVKPAFSRAEKELVDARRTALNVQAPALSTVLEYGQDMTCDVNPASAFAHVMHKWGHTPYTGPSGTTTVMAAAGKALGLNGDEMAMWRLAMMAWQVNHLDHSMAEVALGFQNEVPFAPGPDFYDTLLTLDVTVPDPEAPTTKTISYTTKQLRDVVMHATTCLPGVYVTSGFLRGDDLRCTEGFYAQLHACEATAVSKTFALADSSTLSYKAVSLAKGLHLYTGGAVVDEGVWISDEPFIMETYAAAGDFKSGHVWNPLVDYVQAVTHWEVTAPISLLLFDDTSATAQKIAGAVGVASASTKYTSGGFNAQAKTDFIKDVCAGNLLGKKLGVSGIYIASNKLAIRNPLDASSIELTHYPKIPTLRTTPTVVLCTIDPTVIRKLQEKKPLTREAILQASRALAAQAHQNPGPTESNCKTYTGIHPKTQKKAFKWEKCVFQAGHWLNADKTRAYDAVSCTFKEPSTVPKLDAPGDDPPACKVK